MSLVIDWLGGNCPVQAEGTLDGVPFYFRARGTSVTVDVGDEWPHAGWISEPLARAYIDEAYLAWMERDTPRRFVERELRWSNDRRALAMKYIGVAVELKQALGDAAGPAYDWLIARAAIYAARKSDD
jgi:hypothetical protein